MWYVSERLSQTAVVSQNDQRSSSLVSMEAKLHLHCRMQNGNVFLYLHFPILYVQYLVQNKNENCIISFKFAIFYTRFNMQIINIF